MRPLQLSFSGIRSYAGAVGPLNFTGKSSIAILGDTGAGKSTILEAITLGLYGNCTWSGGGHKELMAEQAAQMTVDLTFMHDDQRWRVHRVFHANTTPSSHLLQNLETGEQIDNARAVNRKIETLLQLSFDSFKSAVLLPQGEFDRLLTATGTIRTGLLKSIFGVQVIETMRDRASRHHDQLTELIHQADLARHDLLDDPAGAATAAGNAAEQAERLAEYFHQTLDSLRSCHQQASDARDQHAKLTAASTTLNEHEHKDVAGELARVSEATGEIADLEARAARAKEDFQEQERDADKLLTDAAHEGLTPETLAAAATVLDAVPGRLEELEAEQAQLDKDADAIAAQARQLETATSTLTSLQAVASTLARKLDTANTALGEYRQALGWLQDNVITALREAAKLGQALRQERRALGRADDLQRALSPLETAASKATTELQAAEDQRTEIRSRESAHVAGAGLTAGDPCLICGRRLPDDYLPPAPADPDALRTAETTAKEAKEAEQAAATHLAKAQADAATAQRQYDDYQSATRRARTRLAQAYQDAVAAMRDLAQRPSGDATRSAGDREFDARLQAACTQLSEADSDDDDEPPSTAARELLGPAREAEQTLADAASAAEKAARKAQADADRAADKLTLQRQTHDQEVTRLADARKRHQAALSRLSRDLTDLPVLAREAIPADALTITPGHIGTARQIITQRQEQLDILRQRRDQATRELTELAATQRQLDQRRSREVNAPLQALGTYLERWQDVIEQAVSVVPDIRPLPVMPARPAAITAEDVGSYATALVQAEITARDSLARAAIAADKEASSQLLMLDAAAAGLRSGRDGIPAIALAEGRELLEPAALDPVIAAEGNARDAAERYRAQQNTAQSQIQRAASLDTAMSAGKARLSAIDALRRLLSDGKFPQHLTDRRTRALLGVATSIFRRLSGGEFGFAEDFQVVSIRSGVARSPKTLSGGETFLASLALALALVELHSRSGARLGALFLDEGFGSLDADALASSLAVLQAETGGDKLVAVISHLHAVAEVVEDVMWVERRPEGSSARWLNAAERDALVREEVTSGLLSLV
jgi:DNA repair protein SbcC/Rad50